VLAEIFEPDVKNWRHLKLLILESELPDRAPRPVFRGPCSGIINTAGHRDIFNLSRIEIASTIKIYCL
jgi:hypothetical protein